MPVQAPQQNGQQNSTISYNQQLLNTNDTDSGTPVWAINLMQNLGEQEQNQWWQVIESKIEHQNVRMTNMETQMSQLNVLKQSVNKTTHKVENLDTDIKSMQKKDKRIW